MEGNAPLARLRELEDLFGHRWDALALLCLAAAPGPLRYRALLREMNRHSDEHLADTDLNRVLHRLADAGLVQRVEEGSRHSPYTLTPAGVGKAARVDSILTAVRKFATAPGAESNRSPASARIAVREKASAITVPSGRWEVNHRGWNRPRGAGVYDYLLGGSHWLDADRHCAEELIAAEPLAPLYAVANREFLVRAVRFLVDAGIRQFLDLGSGIPTVGNVHEVAQGIAPDARVVYVELDPVAVAHSRLILQRAPNVVVLQADLRDLDTIVHASTVHELLRLDEPAAVLMLAVLQNLRGDLTDHMGRLRTLLAPGSYMAISHPTSHVTAAAQEISLRYQPVALRTLTEIRALFAGFDLVEPGLVGVQQWRPDHGTAFQLDPQAFVAGVGRLP